MTFKKAIKQFDAVKQALDDQGVFLDGLVEEIERHQVSDEVDAYLSELANDIEREVDAMHNEDKTVTDLIRKWSIDRHLHTADPHKQALKLGEEFGELFEGLAKGNEEMTKDALGDMYVVMTIMAQQLGFNIEECIEIAYGEIKHRKGRMVDGVFIKESDLDDNR